jgi:hypothetical protein
VLDAKRRARNPWSPWRRQVGAPHKRYELKAVLSTIVGGVYWKPVFRQLEGLGTVLVVNAQHMKNVPGRKTDVQDAEWIAELVQHGLLRASLIPNLEQRALRDLT